MRDPENPYERQGSPAAGQIQIMTPEDTFIRMFLDSRRMRENFGFVHEDGKLVFRDHTKIPQDSERKEWIRKAYKIYNARVK